MVPFCDDPDLDTCGSVGREELRYRLRHADSETRRIATIELDL
jgi:hypothetical protein